MILVDQVRWYDRPVERHHYWCHMVSDTSLDELHEFAKSIGLQRSWFQNTHYDLTPSRRTLAVTKGALLVDSKELVKRMIRVNGKV